MPDDRDLIRSRIDLVALVGEKVKLSRSGKKWKGLCPFHAEKTPSFYVDSELQLFHCFGCKKGGDVFGWTMEAEGVDFRQALEMLASRAGIQLTRTGPNADVTKKRLEINEDALTFFRVALTKSDRANQYLQSRGLDGETIAKWQIGFAPATEYELGTYLGRKKHSLREAEEIGLLSTTADGYLDFFRGRIMFPIRDDQGRLVGFSGRSLDGTEPKYINTRETALFHKGSTLFGFYQAKPLAKESRRIVLVEGQMDVIACQSAGCPAAAPLGTALTEPQAEKLKRFADEVVVAYDGDKAGRTAAEKAFEVLRVAGVRRSAALFQPGEDPDTLLRNNGAVALQKLLDGRISPLRYRIAWLLRDFDARPGISDAGFWDGAQTFLAGSQNLLEVDAIIDELSAYHPNAKVDRLGVVRALRNQVALQRDHKVPRKSTVHKEGTLPKPRGPERLLLLAAIEPEFRPSAWPYLAEDDLIVSDGGRQLADALLEISLEPPADSKAEIAARLEPEVRSALIALDASIDPLGGISEPLSDAAIMDARERLLKEKARRQRLRQYTASQQAETLEEMYGRANTEKGE